MKNIIASSLRMRKFRQQVVKSKKIYCRKKNKKNSLAVHF